MRIRRKTDQNQATTLVEMVFALAIVALCGGAVLAAIGYGFNVLQQLRENQRATQVLLEKAETIRLYNWEQINSNGFILPTFTAVYDPKAPPGHQGVTYHGTISLSPFHGATSYQSQMRLITVTLQWTSPGATHNRTLVTTVARDGEQNYVW